MFESRMEFEAKDSVSVDSHGRAPRALLVPLHVQGHFSPMVQIMRMLARSRINFTVLCTQQRCDELTRYKAEGDFGDVDVDFVGLFRDFVKLIPPSPIPHMEEDWKSRCVELDPSRYTCMITDFFTYFIQDDADKWGIPNYPVMSCTGYPTLYFLQGDEIVEGGWAFDDPAKRHQSITLPGMGLFTPVQIPRTVASHPPELILPKVASGLRRSAGLLLNSFEAFDKEPLEVLSRQNQISQSPAKVFPRVFPIGPLLSLPQFSEELDQFSSFRNNKSAVETREIIDWLDDQQKSSVLFISFGSLRPLPETGIKAFAEALEQTRVPFLWVLRLPPQSTKHESLPPGFEARTKAQGIVWTGWVPQQELLQHSSIGGFLSHSGWNSLVEAICAGVPIAACPMYAEQGFNAKYIVEVLEIAVEVKYKSAIFDFDSDAVAAAISTLMDEKKVKKVKQNLRNMQNAVFEAVAEGGSSYRSFQEFVAEILRPKTLNS